MITPWVQAIGQHDDDTKDEAPGLPDLALDNESNGSRRSTGPLSGFFVENDGQFPDDDLLFVYPGSPTVLVHHDGITVEGSSGDDGPISYRMRIDGAHPEPRVVGSEPGPVLNFYLGNDPDTWTEGVASFGKVILYDVIEGVDIILKVTSEGPKWELSLDRGDILDDLSIRYESAHPVSIDGPGHLSIGKGEVRLIEGPFILIQENEPVKFDLELDRGSLRFRSNEIDPLSPLLVDPLLSDSTYIGGNSWDIYPKVASHPSGDVIIAGTTESTNLATHLTAHDRTNDGSMDLFISRMSPDLSTLRFATYFGGSSRDRLFSLAINTTGSILVCGQTSSGNLPATPGSFQGSYQGGYSDGFAAAFDPTLGTLSYSTYIGGTGEDWATGVDTDEYGAAYVCGSSFSDDLPTTSGAYQTILNGVEDAFILKLEPDGSDASYLTYLGGNGFGDEADDIAVDRMGRAVVVGYSVSDDFPTTPGAFKRGSGFYMGFVSRLEPDGSALNMSTFLAYGTRINATYIGHDGSIYLTGRTETISGEFPVSQNAYDRDLSGNVDGFVTRLAPNGSVVLYSTYLGDNEQYGKPPGVVEDYIEGCTDIFVDEEGRAIVSGFTDSTFFPTTIDAFDSTRSKLDGFLTILSSDLSSLEYSTLIGGSDEDLASGVSYDGTGYVYLGGHTYSNTPSHDFPTTRGAYDTSFNSQYDMFLARFKLDSYLPGPPENLTSSFGPDNILLSWDYPSYDGNEPVREYLVYRGASPSRMDLINITELEEFNDTGLVKGRTYHYMVRARNVVGAGPGALIHNTPYSLPGAPTYRLITPFNSGINISWNPPSDNGGWTDLSYEIRWGISPSLLDRTIMNISDEWLVLEGLTNGVTYHFSVHAVNNMGVGPGSPVSSATPLGSPTPPRNLSATPSDRSVMLSWDPPADFGGSSWIGYNVYRWLNDSYFWPVKLQINSTNVTMSGLENGRSHTFFVTAVNFLGEGAPTERITAVPLGPVSEPFNLTGREYGTWVSLRWDPPNVTGGADRIIFGIFSGNDPLELTGPILNTTSDNCTLTNLTPGRHYYFAVKAFNDVFNSSMSNIIHLRPLEYPTPPREPRYIRGDSYINVSWEPPVYTGGDEGVSYTIHVGRSMIDVLKVAEVERTWFNLTGLKNGLNYLITLRAVNDKGPSPYSEFLNATPMAIPSMPRHLTYSDGDGMLNISWEAPFDLGGARSVTYSVHFGTNTSDLETITSGLSDRFLVIDGLVNGRTYFVGVTALNIMGESEMAGPMEAVPMTSPGKVVISNISEVNEGLLITWLPPEDDGGSEIWYYHIYRGVDGGEMVLLDTVGGHVTSFTDKNVERGTTYTYAVSAESSYSRGPLSDSVVFLYPVVEDQDRGIEWGLLLPIIAPIIALVPVIAAIIIITKRRRTARDRRMWEE